MSLDVAIVADDLTGACDSGIAFAERGMTVMVEVEPGACDADGVLVLNSESRDVSTAEARRRLSSCVERVLGAKVLIKKVDSVFRGNTMEEIVALVEMMPEHIFLLAPAFPEMDRVAVEGVVLHESGQRPVPVLRHLEEHGVTVQHVAASEEPAVIAKNIAAGLRRGCRMYFCDASIAEQMQAIARAGSLLEEPVLWIGSGGLARALSELQPVRVRRAQHGKRYGRSAVVVGSTHAKTFAQLEALRADALPAEVTSTECVIPQAETCVLVCLRGAETDRAVMRRVADALQPETTACLVMTGGDTALLACRELGAKSIELTEEFARGVPIGVLRGGKMDGTNVVLKSGGFGERELLLDVVRRFERAGDGCGFRRLQ